MKLLTFVAVLDAEDHYVKMNQDVHYGGIMEWVVITTMAKKRGVTPKEVHQMTNPHPIFQSILNGTFLIPTGEVNRNTKPQDRPLRNEDYLEFHESRDELQYESNDYGRGKF